MTNVIIEQIITALFMSSREINPALTIRCSPSRSWSTPEVASPKSLAKLDRICSKKAVSRVNKAAGQSISPYEIASEIPTSQPESASGNVRNRKALTQFFNESHSLWNFNPQQVHTLTNQTSSISRQHDSEGQFIFVLFIEDRNLLIKPIVFL